MLFALQGLYLICVLACCITLVVLEPEYAVPGGPFEAFDVRSSNQGKVNMAFNRGRTLYEMSMPGIGALLVLMACMFALCIISEITCYISYLAFHKYLTKIQKIHTRMLVSFEIIMRGEFCISPDI